MSYTLILRFSTRMIEIQNDMSERAIELLALPDDQPCFVLDIGCGSGLSGECLDEQGHYWIGIDISISMLSKSTDSKAWSTPFISIIHRHCQRTRG